MPNFKICGALATLSLVTRTEKPSGGLLIAVSMPIVPPAPVRFSITICWPIARDTGSPTRRATKSSPPPGASGTMKRTGRLGHVASVVPCARAAFGPCGARVIPPSSAMPPAAARLINVRRSILGNSFPHRFFESILHFDVGLRVQRWRDRPVAQSRYYDVIEARDDRARRGGGREQPESVDEFVAFELRRCLGERSRVGQLR